MVVARVNSAVVPGYPVAVVWALPSRSFRGDFVASFHPGACLGDENDVLDLEDLGISGGDSGAILGIYEEDVE